LVRLHYALESLEVEGRRLHVEDLGDRMLPAVGQGAIALQCRADDAVTRDALEAINHRPTFQCIRAERELLRLLDGDCQLPVGARTRIEGVTLHMEAIVYGDGDPQTAEASGEVERPEDVAQAVYRGLTT
jgi:hydroxymethylbilane synthase